MGGGGGIRILGIDPGTLVVGFGCLELGPAQAVASSDGDAVGERPLALAAANVMQASGGRFRVRALESGVLRLGGRNAAIEDRLHRLLDQLSALLARLRIDEVALEQAFYKKNVAAALRIGEARGVILASVRQQGAAVHQFTPARIKRAVAGNGAASKDAVARLVCQQLGLASMPSPRDVTDALAVAFCRAEEHHSGDFRGGAACRTDPRNV
jgi:crossover junction endodeoxyribonuclease RuvC